MGARARRSDGAPERLGCDVDEVSVLAAAGERAGRTVGTGLRLVRRGAVGAAAGGAGAGVVGLRGVGRGAAAWRRHRAVLAADSHQRRLALRRAVPALPDLALPRAGRARRRWPWVVVGAGVLGGGALVAGLLRVPAPPPPAAHPPRVDDPPRAVPQPLP